MMLVSDGNSSRTDSICTMGHSFRVGIFKQFTFYCCFFVSESAPCLCRPSVFLSRPRAEGRRRPQCIGRRLCRHTSRVLRCRERQDPHASRELPGQLCELASSC